VPKVTEIEGMGYMQRVTWLRNLGPEPGFAARMTGSRTRTVSLGICRSGARVVLTGWPLPAGTMAQLEKSMERVLRYDDCPACGRKACVQVSVIEMRIEEGPMPSGEVSRFCTHSDCPTRAQPS
jgi:hypothetical protein